MSKRTLAATCVLLVLPAFLPMAHALPASASPGACVSAGDPPDRPPAVAVDQCGPKVLLRLLTPAGSLLLEVDVGPCRDGCGVTVVLEVVLCSPPSRTPWLETPPALDAEWPLMEGILDDFSDQLEIPIADGAPAVIEMETAFDCD